MPEVIVEDLPQDQQSPGSPAVAVQTDPVEHLALAERYGIDSANKEESGKLAEIWGYAKGLSESKEITDVIWQVMHLEQMLGAPRLGESRLDRLYRFSKLKRHESQIQEELKGVAIGSSL